VLPAELFLVRRTTFLRRVPLLRRLHRRVTARFTLLGEGPDMAPVFRLEFQSPYLHQPLEVERSQIGQVQDRDTAFVPASFRCFDWESWVHIDGEIEWRGAREAVAGGRTVPLVTGFTYRPAGLPRGTGNLGLRVAEGVEGTLRVLGSDKILSLPFEPGYWMLERSMQGWRVVPIRDTDLMVLIVSLSEVGGGKEPAYTAGVENLWQWVSFHCDCRHPEHAMLKLMRYVRDWGPLAMTSLYRGLVEILRRLDVPDVESVLFELFADHCGVRDNRRGRLLAVRTLEALGTEVAGSALREILAYVRHRGLDPQELALIAAAAGEAEQGRDRAVDGADRPMTLPLHPAPAE